jgi:SAM-dependent methyltransferase
MTMRFQQIVRFNWPYYVGAAMAVATGIAALATLPLPAWIRYPLEGGIALVALWLLTSLVASWMIYDRSRLMDWDWVLQALGFSPASWINLHAGHDPSTSALEKIFAGATGQVFDLYDARQLADARQLPLPKGTVDVAMLVLSAHELRSDEARSALFAELRRVLGPAGRVVVAEHMRDWANFLAYGPAVLRFYSRRTWIRCFARHRFDVHREFSITPFVRVFVLRRLT